jgi:predicted Ser/Thr protein kinase
VNCPSDDTLVAMIEHALAPPAFAELERHIDSCESCRRVVAAAATAHNQGLAVGTRPAAVGTGPVPTLPADGRYEIESQLGSGGMGTVYLARDKSLGREVALKVHRAGSGHDRLHREAIAMAKLAHPNVVTVFEVTSIDDRLCVAMEYVRGKTLRGWLRGEPRAWREIAGMLLGAGAGLAAAHDAGLVHRDFKPENVLVGDDGRPRVGDFGLARVGAETSPPPKDDVLLSLTTPMTVTGTVLGTPAYMSPEQLGGETVDARADQFAFCVVAWECIFGRRPFAGTTLAALQIAIEKQEPSFPKDLGVPERVRAVLARGLAVNPTDRHADMHALLASLRDAMRSRTRRRATIAALAILATGGAAVAGTRTYETHRHEAACAAEGDAIRGRFGDAARDQMRGSFLATSSPSAASSFEHSFPVLKKSADALANEAVATCRGRDESAPASAARRACLASHDSSLANLADLFAHADASLVKRAPDAAWASYDPAPCADATVLAAGAQRKVARSPEETAELSRVRALEGVGKYRDAAAAAQRLVDGAKTRGARDLELEALNELGQLRAKLDGPDTVGPIHHQVLALAESLGRDLDAAIALNDLANLAGAVQHDHTAAHQYIELARAKLARLGNGNLAAKGALLATETQILWDENRLGEAERAIREGISVEEQALGPDHPKVGNMYGILSEVLRAESKNAEALGAAEKTLAILTAAFGDDHPTVAGSQMNLASNLIDVKRYDDARDRLLKADAVFARVFGEAHPTRAAIWGNLGQLEQMQEHWDAAIDAYRKARVVLDKIGDHAGAAATHSDEARVLTQIGRHDDAIAEQKVAIAMYEKLGDDGLPRLAPALADLAGFELDANRPERALPIAERAVKVGESRPADANPSDLADARFALAAALWDVKGGDRVRAKKLALQARDAEADPTRKAAIVDWLAKH